MRYLDRFSRPSWLTRGVLEWGAVLFCTLDLLRCWISAMRHINEGMAAGVDMFGPWFNIREPLLLLAGAILIKTHRGWAYPIGGLVAFYAVFWGLVRLLALATNEAMFGTARPSLWWSEGLRSWEIPHVAVGLILFVVSGYLLTMAMVRRFRHRRDLSGRPRNAPNVPS
jgi:hypothetical protein